MPTLHISSRHEYIHRLCQAKQCVYPAPKRSPPPRHAMLDNARLVNHPVPMQSSLSSSEVSCQLLEERGHQSFPSAQTSFYSHSPSPDPVASPSPPPAFRFIDFFGFTSGVPLPLPGAASSPKSSSSLFTGFFAKLKKSSSSWWCWLERCIHEPRLVSVSRRIPLVPRHP